MGPMVSWWDDMGITRNRLVRPTVGLIAARLFCWPGERIEPEVSVPNDAHARPIEDDTPLPLDEPDGSSDKSISMIFRRRTELAYG